MSTLFRLTLSACAILFLTSWGGATRAAGNLATNPTVVELTLNADKTLSKKEIDLETGKYYRLDLTNKISGIGDVLFMSPELLRNSWINQAKVGTYEFKSNTFYALEFDAGDGPIQLTFLPVKPGSYKYWVQGQEGTMTGTFVVK